MKVSEYIASFLVSHGVTDVFGIPGGVILDFIYALDAVDGITPHLNYHEQTAGFAACGYAQSSGRLGVAYATRGPGFTNLITPISDAYYDSIPVLFVTGHTTIALPTESRSIEDQEVDTCSMVHNITKYAKRIDNLDDVQPALEEAYSQAISGRRGPVLLDVNASLFKQDIILSEVRNDDKGTYDMSCMVDKISSAIRGANRPVILAGDGINQCQLGESFNIFVRKAGIPVLSSRYSHNLLNNPDYYYGYVGSHGIRYANFILSKADLIITLGNRMCFPSQSSSFKPVLNNARIMRFDIDTGEFLNHADISDNVQIDLNQLMLALTACDIDYGVHADWVSVCRNLRTILWQEDCCDVVGNIVSILDVLPENTIIVSDVGNNEFWVSRACVLARCSMHTLYSKSFAVLGNALGKAIGAYYATNKRTIVFIGDQGLQLNIQELQFISQHQLPIVVVLLDNSSSGMIKDRETITCRPYYLHTTKESGYSNPDFEKIVRGYDIAYYQYSALSNEVLSEIIASYKPVFVHLNVDMDTTLTPFLPKGQPLQDMMPLIDRKLYNELNVL